MAKRRKLNALNWKSVEHVYLNLGTTEAELAKLLGAKAKHYRSRDIVKPNVKTRRIDAPQGRLKEILQRLNANLQRVEVHRAVHGGIQGRSNVTNASQHRRRPGLVKADVENFFPSVRRGRIHKLFVERLACSPPVAALLADLVCLNGALPQGSPTSPILAAFATEGLARRLTGLAHSVGGGATVYVDDSAVSGPAFVAGQAKLVERIIAQEGFTPHPSKTESFGPRDTKVVTGAKVSGKFDAPPDMVEAIDKAISELEAAIALPSDEVVRSLKGRISYVKQLNQQRAWGWHRRLGRVLKRFAPKGT